MNDIKHISEADLASVVADQPTAMAQKEIETHVAECEMCQTRLLNAAGDPSWREVLAGNFSDPELLELDDSTTKDQIGGNQPPGDEFDLQSVDQMLKDILQPPTHPEMLGRLGRYDVEGIIGCGGMGVVLRGFDSDLHRPVAIKMILPRLSKNGTAKQRFAREARAAAVILHPNVIPIFGIDSSCDIPWFAMPLIVGPSLKTLVDQQGPLAEKEIVRIGMQIASGLAAAHSQGLVHRDVKPENILVDNQVNRVVITDFGLAQRDADESMTQTGMVAGTLSYMSPEQSRGEEIDARSDLFSLGSLLYFLATGSVPFRATAPMGVVHKIGFETHPAVQSLNPDISTTLSSAIDRLLEKKPAHRFQSAVALESFLNDFLLHLHQPQKTPLPLIPAAKKKSADNSSSRKSKRWGWVAAAVLVALAFWAGVKFWPNPQSPAIEPVVTSWSDIKEKYRIEDPDQFMSDLATLGREFERVNQSFQEHDEFGFAWQFPAGGRGLGDDLESFAKELARLSNDMEFMSGSFESSEGQ